MGLNDYSLEDIMKYVEEHEEQIELPQKTNSSSNFDIEQIKFKLLTNFGTLSNRKASPNLCLVEWNGYRRLDLRAWKNDMTIPLKGITFDKGELERLIEFFSSYSFETPSNNLMREYIAGKAHAKFYDKLCELSVHDVNGITWKKEINIIDWGFGKKVDLRKWTVNYDRCSKGISIPFEEFKCLKEMVTKI